MVQTNASAADVPEDSDSPRHNWLLLDGLRLPYGGVKNAYLAFKLKQLFCFEGIVEGSPMLLKACTCCGYRTITDQGYDVCPLCSWEDDGVTNETAYSSVNHGTLGAYRSRFAATPHSQEELIRFPKAV